ncbi:hypothetical protein P3S68_012354 [Capsicum galapagoense]
MVSRNGSTVGMAIGIILKEQKFATYIKIPYDTCSNSLLKLLLKTMRVLRKEPLTVYGDAKQTRSFQFVSDLRPNALDGWRTRGTFNLGNPGEFTMLELAGVIQETIDRNAQIEFRPNTADDPHKRQPDISKAKELLGWEPKVPLRKGLPMMVQDFRQRIFGDHKENSSSVSSA